MKKLESATLGIAVGIGAAIFWTLCSILVALAPGPSLAVTRDLFHLLSGGDAWGVTWSGYFVGLCGWSVGAGIFAWLCAGLYNRMLAPRRTVSEQLGSVTRE
jgi:hypothetical protein